MLTIYISLLQPNVKDTNMSRQKYYLKYLYLLTVCYLTISLFSSCESSKNKKEIDVSKIDVQLKSHRFDKDLFACDTNHLKESINVLGNKYPDFANVYFKEITGFDRNNDNLVFLNSVRHFITYKDYKNLYDTVQIVFPNTNEMDASLSQLFKHVKYYFPNEKLGDVYYFISGLNSWSAVTVDTALGIGLDMHLGKDYPYYASVQLPEYQIEHCEKEYIPINASKVIYENIFPFEPDGKNLLELMLMKGKQQLFMEYTLPTTNDELLMGYTTKQLEWCKDNEAMIWNYFSAQKLLYSTNWQDVMRYVNEGPNSTGMPLESPGNIGTWIGWQIIRKYMDEHPEKTMVDILKSSIDAQTLLRDSGYRPRS
ncbi:MAG TPA: hypothetical protein PLU17_00045 [Chitinophagaceae bacterium]|nr:hypothetical protein [Chitinophagaceae bacterium]